VPRKYDLELSSPLLQIIQHFCGVIHAKAQFVRVKDSLSDLCTVIHTDAIQYNALYQGTLTEDEGSVQFTSSLW